MDLQTAINKNFETIKYNAEYKFQTQVDGQLQIIINIQNQIAKLTEQLTVAKKELKELKYVEPVLPNLD